MSQFLRFALGSGHCVVDLGQVREILEIGPLTPVPLMPAFVRGVMNLRGAVVPVIDLGTRLGLEVTRLGRRSCIVMIDLSLAHRDGPLALGMLVDAVEEVFEAGESDHEAVPPLGTWINRGYLRSMVRVRGVATPELDLQAALDPTALGTLIGEHALPH